MKIETYRPKKLNSPQAQEHKENYTRAHHSKITQNLW